MILGIGRGLARVEYEGSRVDMHTCRERLVKYARLITEGHEVGYMGVSATLKEPRGQQGSVEPREHPTAEPPSPPPGIRTDALIVAGIMFTTLTVYVYLVYWLKNTNLVTTNGLWKLPAVEQWSHFHVGTIDPSNFLYFPLTGLGITLLPESLLGAGWVRESVLNACWGSVAVGAIFVTCRMMKMSRVAAAAAALAQFGFAFFIALGVTNEDIMGGYALLCLALCAGVWSSRLAGRRALVGWTLTGVLFACTFLWEWRLIFPSLPGFGLAIVLLAEPIRERVLRLAAFGGGILLTLVVAVVFWHTVDDNAGGFVHRFTTLLWTGKATDTGWAGWSTLKLRYLLFGTTQYVIGGQNLADGNSDAIREPRTYVVAVLIIALFVTLLFWGWRRRHESPVVVGVTVAAVTFVAACTMNLWSQPQDPQMELNAMLFLSISIGVTTQLLRAPWRRSPETRRARRDARHRRAAVGLLACAIGPVLLVVNVWGDNGYAQQKGGDPTMIARARALTTRFDPARTVFVFQGFEGESTWISELYGLEWDLPWGSPPTPHVKVIGMATTPVFYPSLSPGKTAEAVIARIDDAMKKGYRVVANPMWALTRAQFEGSLGTVASTEKTDALYDRMHAAYCARPITVRQWGEFYVLTQRSASGACP
jgi:hypothetical protein